MSRLQVYLILKEAINNAVKYSRANIICLRIERQEACFIFEVKDDGIGFVAGLDYSGNGLVNMKKRSREIGGDLMIQSESEKGTTVKLLIKIIQ